jgi:hypothetical protein
LTDGEFWAHVVMHTGTSRVYKLMGNRLPKAAEMRASLLEQRLP